MSTLPCLHPSAIMFLAEIFRPPRDQAHSSPPASCHLGVVNNPSLSLSHSCLYYLVWCIHCLLPKCRENLLNLPPPHFLIFSSSSSVSVCIERVKIIPSDLSKHPRRALHSSRRRAKATPKKLEPRTFDLGLARILRPWPLGFKPALPLGFQPSLSSRSPFLPGPPHSLVRCLLLNLFGFICSWLLQ